MDHALLQHVWHIAGPLFRSLSVRIMRSIYCIHTCILSAQASTRLAHRRTFGSQARALVWGGGGGRKSYTPWPPPPPIQPFSITKTNPKQQPPGALKFCKHIHVPLSCWDQVMGWPELTLEERQIQFMRAADMEFSLLYLEECRATARVKICGFNKKHVPLNIAAIKKGWG
eukprot:jgi/Botrbrau1/7986/Bobra.384_2s0014.1